MQPASAYAAALVGAALLSAGLIRLLHPLLVRYALARPNARSSHRVPTPQGGGIAVVAAALALGLGCAAALAGAAALPALVGLAAAAIILAALGAADDIRPLPALPRLLVQMAAVAAIVWLADPARILPEAVPLPVERALLVLAGTWWVNLVNFMDGIDWITVAEFVPLCGAIAIAALAGLVPVAVGAMAAALCGALLGFAPANRPVARLFLGDVGSLPIGLLTGWLLLSLAGSGHLAAALLLPLYHVMDATLTLLRRALRRERVWEAHRSHFYQRATDAGFRVIEIDAHIVVLNLVLAGLAAATMLWPATSWPALGIGLGLTALLLRRFITPRSV
ncbi:glycosyl transferase [Enterovirga rhinocerotis]|uniref:UDP-N-acetylmuramyl pentapeptide phosphotransferase/UDP-N-acetylglucosamine-1-phosphate transferase n=1 Tax=Enterovirga rhinocerotis TaxID=1339210 RepID=A0A4R7BYT5_9HYPH|nr:glycosyl transferase [Enterovirga rhinocerotis]TDR90442.1 UDP-N-acetylmuramyl pentapeptide phosphotransferase/UDP-N-acetylglucosamine-1-phosphate transferase [Enterovirga rhinocerotis]